MSSKEELGPSLPPAWLALCHETGSRGQVPGPFTLSGKSSVQKKSHIPLIVICTPLSPLGPFSSVTWSCAFEAASVNFPGCVNGLQVYSLGHQPCGRGGGEGEGTLEPLQNASTAFSSQGHPATF